MMKRNTVVLDTTTVIKLAQTERFHVLGISTNLEFVMPEQVIAEVIYPEEMAVLQNAIAAEYLREEPATDLQEIALYNELKLRMGKGEAACLAMAAVRGWKLVSDDRGRAFRRMVREHIGEDRIIDTPELLRLLGGGEREEDELAQEDDE